MTKHIHKLVFASVVVAANICISITVLGYKDAEIADLSTQLSDSSAQLKDQNELLDAVDAVFTKQHEEIMALTADLLTLKFRRIQAELNPCGAWREEFPLIDIRWRMLPFVDFGDKRLYFDPKPKTAQNTWYLYADRTYGISDFKER